MKWSSHQLCSLFRATLTISNIQSHLYTVDMRRRISVGTTAVQHTHGDSLCTTTVNIPLLGLDQRASPTKRNCFIDIYMSVVHHVYNGS